MSYYCCIEYSNNLGVSYMKNNIIYVNFSYGHKKKRLKSFFQNLFRKKSTDNPHIHSKNSVIKIEDFEVKDIL